MEWMLRTLVPVLALGLLSACQTAAPLDEAAVPSAARHCFAAARAVSEGSGEDAAVVAACTQAIDAKPSNSMLLADLLTARGVAYRNQGYYDAALADLDKALRISPRDASTANMRAWTFREMGDYAAAEAAYSDILKDDSSRAQAKKVGQAWQAYLSRCVVRQDLGRFDLALDDCVIALEGERTSDSLYFSARAYAKLGHCREAVPLLEDALLEDDLLPRVFELLGYAHICDGDEQKALSVLDDGLTRFPGNEELQSMRRWITGV